MFFDGGATIEFYTIPTMIHALYHAPTETLGDIATVLKAERLAYRECHLYRGDALPTDAQTAEGLIVMGGPMNVDDTDLHPFLEPEIALIRRLFDAGVPVLGVCLGAQLMAKALGSAVYPNARREVGWHPVSCTEEGRRDPIFRLLGEAPVVFHWHGDTFDLPSGATWLALSEHCRHQAFRYANSYALQFHLEVSAPMVAEWCADPSSPDYLRGAGETVSGVLAASSSAHAALRPFSEAFFREYVRSAFVRRSAVPL